MNRMVVLRSLLARKNPCAAVTTTRLRLFGNDSTVDTVRSNGQADSEQHPQMQYGESIPAEFCKSYHITGLGERSGTCLKTDTGHEIRTDLPRKMGGNDTNAQPVELLLAALIGCTQATAVFVGRNMKPRVLIDRLEFDIHACRDERGALALPIVATSKIPPGLRIVVGTVKVHVKKGSMSASQLEILAEQTEARCPVASMMVAGGCNMRMKWINGEAEQREK